MVLSKRAKSKGHWRGGSSRDYKNCYKGNDENEADSVIVIVKGRLYFASQLAYCQCTHQTYTVLGPEVTEETRALAEENMCW
jgi:hypothetical protein